jgi:hypothetical protein
MAVAGDHHPVPGSDRLECDELRLGIGSGERDAARVGRPGEHDTRTGRQEDENWPDRCSAYMVAEDLPS